MSAKTIGIGAAIIVALAGGVVGAWWMFQPNDSPPPPPPEVSEQSPEDVAQYLASEQFAKLDEAKRQEYFDRVVADKPQRRAMRAAHSELNEQQRKQLQKNVRPLARRMMRRRMDRYFETKDPREKTAFLDEIIDDMQARRQARGDRSGRTGTTGTSTQPDNRDRRGRRHRFTPQRLKHVIETTPPEDRAKFVQFMSDVRKRMKQRGIKPRRRRH